MKPVERDFYIIVALIIFQKSEYLIEIYTGVSLFSLLPFSALILVIIVVLFAIVRINKTSGLTLSNIDPFLSVLLVFIVFQLFRGLLYNPLDIVLQESSTAVIVFYAYILGRNRLVDFSNSTFLRLLVLSGFLVFLGIFRFREHLEGVLNTLLPTATLAYEISPILDLWPLLFLTRYFRNRDFIAVLPLFIYPVFHCANL